MKTKIVLALIGTLLNVKLNIFPSIDLMIVMAFMIVLDFITGVIKSVILKRARTSEGYRKTIIKFTQYGGTVLVGMALKYLAAKNPNELDRIAPFANYLTNGLVIFIILIEATSVLENLYESNPDNTFCKYLVGPLLKILTFQIKNNPISKQETSLQNE